MSFDREHLARMRLVLLAACGACAGEIDSVQEPPAPQGAPTAPRWEPRPAAGSEPPSGGCGGASSLSPSPLRRLSQLEYNNTVRDLIGDASRPADAFPAEQRTLDVNVSVLHVSPLMAEKYFEAAQKLGQVVATHAHTIVPCAADGAADEPCARQLLSTFGKRAFRRPLEAEEVSRYLKVFTVGRGLGGFDKGVALMSSALLQSPSFLYRVELGTPGGAPEKAAVGLTSWELASRLSYLLTGSMPDAELFAAAETGRLTKPGDVLAHAQRLVGDGTRAQVQEFFARWLAVEGAEIGSLQKNPAVFRGWSGEISQLMAEEVSRFLDDVFWTGNFASMHSVTHSYVNGRLATFYGLSGGPTGTGFTRIAHDPTKRAGILTLPGVLAITANHDDGHSPVFRGKFVTEALFCTELAGPPDTVEADPPPVNSTQTTRERYTTLTGGSACLPCHRFLDRIGFGLENYDSVGRFRSTENDKVIDSRADLVGTDVDGPFTGGVELARKIGGSAVARACMARQWFRFAYGRHETEADTCTVDKLRSALDAPNGKMSDLLTALVQTDAFLYLRKEALP